MSKSKKNKTISPLGLRITAGPDATALTDGINKKHDSAFAGLEFEFIKYAYNEQADIPVAMSDRNNNGATIKGKIAAIIVQAVPISRNDGQYLLFCYAKNALALDGQPIPLLEDDGKKPLDKIKLFDATSVLSSGVPANAYFTMTYDTFAKDGEVRFIEFGDHAIDLLSLKSLTGMDHTAHPPLPGACLAPVYDDVLTFGGGNGSN